MLRLTLLVAACTLLIAGCVTVSPQLPATSLPSLPPIPTLAPPTIPAVPTLPGVTAAPQSGVPATSSASLAPLDSAPPPDSGPATIEVSFDSGPNAGTYTTSLDPDCSYGVLDDGTWAAQYGNLSAGATDLSTVQVQIAPDSSGKTGKDFITSVFIVVGPIFGGTNYTVSLDRFSTGDQTADVIDHGSTATIHVRGKSTQSPLGPGGILVDLTVSCPTVNRG